MSTLRIEKGFSYTDVDGNICTVTGRHFDDFEISLATVDDEGFEHPTGETQIVTGSDIRHAVRAFSGEVYDRVVWEEEEE